MRDRDNDKDQGFADRLRRYDKEWLGLFSHPRADKPQTAAADVAVQVDAAPAVATEPAPAEPSLIETPTDAAQEGVARELVEDLRTLLTRAEERLRVPTAILEPQPEAEPEPVEAPAPEPTRAPAAPRTARRRTTVVHFPRPDDAHVEAAYAHSLNPLEVPLQLVVRATPITDFFALTEFEKSLAALDEVVDTRVDQFVDDVADVEVVLARPVAFAHQLRAQFGFEVDDADPGRLLVTVPDRSAW